MSAWNATKTVLPPLNEKVVVWEYNEPRIASFHGDYWRNSTGESPHAPDYWMAIAPPEDVQK